MTASMKRVLVVYKKSAYRLHVLERKDQHVARFLRSSSRDAADMRQAHRVHQQTVEAVVNGLKRVGAAFDLVYRVNLRTVSGYDLVISIGGDGTFLQASHALSHTPLLGVNSDPQRSEAVFCAATRGNFERMLRQILEGTCKGLVLSRLQIALNGRTLWPLALNDVLIAHDNPATMSRYHLRIGSRGEDQKSSGLWIATAAGSSSAILAAGGQHLAWTARRFQYRPRELYQGRLSRCRLRGGILSQKAVVEVTWLMRTGAAFIDGPHVCHSLRFGDRLTVTLSPHQALCVLGVRGPRRSSSAHNP